MADGGTQDVLDTGREANEGVRDRLFVHLRLEPLVFSPAARMMVPS